MAIVDDVQLVCEALVDFVNADTELRTLFGRTTKLIVPAESTGLNPDQPVITYQSTNSGISPDSGLEFLDLQLTAYGPLKATVNKAIARLEYLCNTAGVTFQLFQTRSLDVCPNPSKRPSRIWPGANTEAGESAECRADLLVSFLLPG